jgi:hypothetical protein
MLSIILIIIWKKRFLSFAAFPPSSLPGDPLMNHPTPPRFLLHTFILVLSLAFLFGMAGAARANQIVVGPEVAQGQVIENDAILSGIDVVLDGTVQGDAFVVGRYVTINGDVQGSLFVLGREVTIGGRVQGTTYVSWMGLHLTPSASLARNLYFLGLSLETDPGSTIGRDLVGISLGATLNGDIGRDTKAIIGPLEIAKAIMDLTSDQISGVGVGPMSLVKLDPPGSGGIQLAGIAPLEQWLRPNSSALFQTGGVDTERLQAWFLPVARGFVTLLVVGLIGLWLLRPWVESSLAVGKTRPWVTLGVGLIVLIVSFNIFLLGILLFALVIVLGFGLSSISLGGLAWLVWSVGLTAVGLAFALFWVLVIYGSKAFVAYLIGWLILNRLAPRANRYRIVPLLLGLLLYVRLPRSRSWLGTRHPRHRIRPGAFWFALRGRGQETEEEASSRLSSDSLQATAETDQVPATPPAT